MKRLTLQLFLLGAVLGTIGDFAHVASGTLAYPPTLFWRIPGSSQPLWVPLLMGLAAVSIGLGMRGAPRRTVRCGWAAPLTLILAYAASGYIPLASGGARDLVLDAVAIGNWWLWDGTRSGGLRAAGVAVVGTVFEIALISLGAFYYVSPNMLSIMSWIPCLYFTAASSLGAFVSWQEER